MKLTLELDLDNSAFSNPNEIYRILEHTGKLLSDYPEIWETGYFQKLLLDINGNTVGEVKVMSIHEIND